MMQCNLFHMYKFSLLIVIISFLYKYQRKKRHGFVFFSLFIDIVDIMSNDNILLITAGYDRTIRFWQANTASIYRTIMHEDSVKNRNQILCNKQIFF